MIKIYTWDELTKMEMYELDNLKENLQEELYQKQKEKLIKIQNILSLQGLIEEEVVTMRSEMDGTGKCKLRRDDGSEKNSRPN